MNNIPVLKLTNVRKSFKQGNQTLDVLKGADLEIKTGEIVALVGPSGSGKSTLLQIAGLLEKPDEGTISLAGNDCSKSSDNIRTGLRRDYLGFVYQYHNLLPDFNAVENVCLPQMISGDKSQKDIVKRAEWLLDRLGLKDRKKHRPTELSGGEQQRVAIARGLANTPRLLLAHEPTGNLDPQTSDVVFEELLKFVRETGLSAIIATHNHELASKMDRKITLKDGKIEDLRASLRVSDKNFYDN